MELVAPPDANAMTSAARKQTTNQVVPAEKYAVDASQPSAPPYSPFGISEEAVTTPSEFHQAAVHFILHAAVPFRWKLFYLCCSFAIVALQIIALLGLISDVDELTTDDILTLFCDMGRLDYGMSVLVALLMSFLVYGEMQQARVAELQIKRATLSDDPETANRAFYWSGALILIQRLRHQFLVPLTVITAPILAVENGVDALNVALNVMAILFVFDFDDGAFNALLSQSQRDYFESIEIVIPTDELRMQARLFFISLAASVLAFLMPIILYDPRWQIESGVDPSQVMAVAGGGILEWSFDATNDYIHPTHMCVWIGCLICFGTLGLVMAGIDAIVDQVWQDRRRLMHFALTFAVSAGITFVCTYTTWSAHDIGQAFDCPSGGGADTALADVDTTALPAVDTSGGDVAPPP